MPKHIYVSMGFNLNCLKIQVKAQKQQLHILHNPDVQQSTSATWKSQPHDSGLIRHTVKCGCNNNEWNQNESVFLKSRSEWLFPVADVNNTHTGHKVVTTAIPAVLINKSTTDHPSHYKRRVNTKAACLTDVTNMFSSSWSCVTCQRLISFCFSRVI